MSAKETKILLKYADNPDYDNSIATYIKHGGYSVLKKAIKRKPEELCQEVKDSQVRGRGGAGFPAGVKWGFIDKKSKQTCLFDL